MTKQKIKKLNWDSEFFGINVYRIENAGESDIIKISENLKEPYFLYIFNGTNLLSKEFCNQNDCILVDNKVKLEKNIISPDPKFSEYINIKEYTQKQVNETLLKLTYESGKYSRFKLDKRIPQTKFESLYKEWITNSIWDNQTKVFVSFLNEEITGFITLVLKDNIANIGLIAVSPKFQGKGIGKTLIKFCEKISFELGINTITVITQKHNKTALTFYRNLGFKIKSEENIYHIIRNENSIQ